MGVLSRSNAIKINLCWLWLDVESQTYYGKQCNGKQVNDLAGNAPVDQKVSWWNRIYGFGGKPTTAKTDGIFVPRHFNESEVPIARKHG